MYEPLQAIFPELDIQEPSEKLPTRGRRYFYRIDFVWVMPVIALLCWFFYPYGLWSLVLVPAVMGFGFWQHRSAAWRVSGRQITIRARGFSLETSYTMRKRIQSAELRQTVFQKRKDVATITMNVKSGMGVHTVHIRHMDRSAAEEILDWYEPDAGRTVPPSGLRPTLAEGD